MTYYDHASPMTLKIGAWEQHKDAHYSNRLPRNHLGSTVSSGGWTGLFACFCWFL